MPLLALREGNWIFVLSLAEKEAGSERQGWPCMDICLEGRMQRGSG